MTFVNIPYDFSKNGVIFLSNKISSSHHDKGMIIHKYS